MLILWNARILGYSPSTPALSAIAIQGSTILALGESEDILTRFGHLTEKENMEGKVIWPGLIDAHLHFERYAFNSQKINCETRTNDECIAKVKEKARHVSPGEWILGHGWNQTDWVEGFGNAAQLDQIAPENPVFLTSKSLHSAWINSKTLEITGIAQQFPGLTEGLIQKDRSGKPTGIIFESAMSFCEKFIPPATLPQIKTALQNAQNNLLEMGLTSVHDFDPIDCYEALQLLHQEHKLNIRVVKGIPFDDLSRMISSGLTTGSGDDFLRLGSVKLFADGALGPRTAALFDPYEFDDPNTGLLFLDAGSFLEIGKEAISNKISLAVHAIGDRAVHEILDGYAQIRDYENQHQILPLRHRIEHAQMLQPQDFPQFSSLNIIASMQPTHATSDMFMAEKYWGNRSDFSYAWKTMEDNQVHLAFGSDAPVESPNPFWGIHAAITRCRQDGQPGPDGWHPEQRLSLRSSIDAFTTGAAYAGGMEKKTGKIAPGYLADLIVLEDDPTRISPGQFYAIKPVATMVGGEWMWKNG
jgi:predicted amidohydrolase YtcJ